MAIYPILPKLLALTNKEVRDMYQQINSWGSTLINQLNVRDVEINNRPASNIRVVVTVSEVQVPRKGDIVYAASAGKYKGYVSTAASTTFKDFF